jgi:hypothetical protein
MSKSKGSVFRRFFPAHEIVSQCHFELQARNLFFVYSKNARSLATPRDNKSCLFVYYDTVSAGRQRTGLNPGTRIRGELFERLNNQTGTVYAAET